MVVRRLAIVALSACGFDHGVAASQQGGSQQDAASDSPPDMKIWLDAPATGQLMLSSMTKTGDVDLTAEGTLDWAHWGYGSSMAFDHKNGANIIGNLASPPTGRFTGSPLTATWSDGTPTMNVSSTTQGVYIPSPSALTFSVPASTTSRTLHVYVMTQDVDARLDVSLSDSSATAVQATKSQPSGTSNTEYTIVFNAASDGQMLTVSWTDTQDYGGTPLMGLLSATLQ